MDIMDKYSGTVLFKNCPNKKCPKSVYINTPFWIFIINSQLNFIINQGMHNYNSVSLTIEIKSDGNSRTSHAENNEF